MEQNTDRADEFEVEQETPLNAFENTVELLRQGHVTPLQVFESLVELFRSGRD